MSLSEYFKVPIHLNFEKNKTLCEASIHGTSNVSSIQIIGEKTGNIFDTYSYGPYNKSIELQHEKQMTEYNPRMHLTCMSVPYHRNIVYKVIC